MFSRILLVELFVIVQVLERTSHALSLEVFIKYSLLPRCSVTVLGDSHNFLLTDSPSSACVKNGLRAWPQMSYFLIKWPISWLWLSLAAQCFLPFSLQASSLRPGCTYGFIHLTEKSVSLLSTKICSLEQQMI